MKEFKCKHCKKITLFEHDEKNKFTCLECNGTFTRCKNKDCSNLIKFGVFCSDCMGDGLKRGSVPALAILSTVTLLIKKGRK